MGTGLNTGTNATPVLVSHFAGAPVTKLAVGNTSVCAVWNSEVHCWGRRNMGLVGDGGPTDLLATENEPQAVDKEFLPPGPFDPDELCVGSQYVLAVKEGAL